MSKPIPDYTESQLWTVAESLKERFRTGVDELADCIVSLMTGAIRLQT